MPTDWNSSDHSTNIHSAFTQTQRTLQPRVSRRQTAADAETTQDEQNVFHHVASVVFTSRMNNEMLLMLLKVSKESQYLVCQITQHFIKTSNGLYHMYTQRSNIYKL